MANENKRFFFGFGLGALLLIIIVKTFDRKEKIKQPEVTEQNINTAIDAYRDAVEGDADLLSLTNLNEELAKQFGLRVGLRQDGKYVVINLSGEQVRVAD